jgi:hypothetical protein
MIDAIRLRILLPVRLWSVLHGCGVAGLPRRAKRCGSPTVRSNSMFELLTLAATAKPREFKVPFSAAGMACKSHSLQHTVLMVTQTDCNVSLAQESQQLAVPRQP